MRQIRRSGLATLLVTGGALALSAGAAFADAGAQGAAVGSPGVASGNTIQVPVNLQVNACGDTVDVVGALNPAFGTTCVNGAATPAAPGGRGAGVAGRSAADHEAVGQGQVQVQGQDRQQAGQSQEQVGQDHVQDHVQVQNQGQEQAGPGRGRTHKDLPGTPRTGSSSDHGSREGNGYGGSGYGESGYGGEEANGGPSRCGSGNGGGASAEAVAQGSPGVLSGNGIQVPVDVPVNVSGDSINVVGIGNPAFGTTSVNRSEEECDEPPVIHPPVVHPPVVHPPVTHPPVTTPPGVEPQTPHPAVEPAPAPQAGPPALAHTGAGPVGFAAPTSIALLLGGAMMYRRSRRAAADRT
ncbi:chaplin [Streptomyces sp. NPDC046203]|uniref:chaplin n=1 Tax=Streptomyces sp. NPDC046203 TaxID=3154602 RepID=UPI00340C480E